jgi:hypothetical protein
LNACFEACCNAIMLKLMQLCQIGPGSALQHVYDNWKL